MKKNKGFSLVELIIVIAIMAILAAAIAPALIRYIDKSRKADDVTAAGTIATAANAALANEAAYDSVATAMDGATLIAHADVTSGNAAFTAANTAYEKFVTETNANLTNNTAPKVKYKKAVDNDTTTNLGGGLSSGGSRVWQLYLRGDTPVVYIADSTTGGNKACLAPSIHPDYQ
jgi:type IV pilus assembly protein PilA